MYIYILCYILCLFHVGILDLWGTMALWIRYWNWFSHVTNGSVTCFIQCLNHSWNHSWDKNPLHCITFQKLLIVSMDSGSPLLLLCPRPSLFMTKTLISVIIFIPLWQASYILSKLSLLSYFHLNVIKLVLACCNYLHGYSCEVCE